MGFDTKENGKASQIFASSLLPLFDPLGPATQTNAEEWTESKSFKLAAEPRPVGGPTVARPWGQWTFKSRLQMRVLAGCNVRADEITSMPTVQENTRRTTSGLSDLSPENRQTRIGNVGKRNDEWTKDSSE